MEPSLVKLIKTNVDIGSNLDLWTQVFLFVVLAIYTIFAFLVQKQVGILNRTIKTPKKRLMNTLAQTHLLAATILLIATIGAIVL